MHLTVPTGPPNLLSKEDGQSEKKKNAYINRFTNFLKFFVTMFGAGKNFAIIEPLKRLFKQFPVPFPACYCL